MVAEEALGELLGVEVEVVLAAGGRVDPVELGVSCGKRSFTSMTMRPVGTALVDTTATVRSGPP